MIGLVGLGTMGSRYATRWLEAGYDLVGFDSDPAAVARAVSAGAGQGRVGGRSGRSGRDRLREPAHARGGVRRRVRPLGLPGHRNRDPYLRGSLDDRSVDGRNRARPRSRPGTSGVSTPR